MEIENSSAKAHTLNLLGNVYCLKSAANVKSMFDYSGSAKITYNLFFHKMFWKRHCNDFLDINPQK